MTSIFSRCSARLTETAEAAAVGLMPFHAALTFRHVHAGAGFRPHATPGAGIFGWTDQQRYLRAALACAAIILRAPISVPAHARTATAGLGAALAVLAIVVVIHLSIFGFAPSGYMRQSFGTGFEWRALAPEAAIASDRCLVLVRMRVVFGPQAREQPLSSLCHATP